MESKKVKETKKALEYAIQVGLDKFSLGASLSDCLTLINELESENERWQKDCADIANDYQEMGKFYFEETEKNQQLKDRIANLENIGLNENITVAEYIREMQRLKDRIAELESARDKLYNLSQNLISDKQVLLGDMEKLKEQNERFANRITCQVVLPDKKLEEIKKECLEKVEVAKDKLLKQFAERLIEKMGHYDNGWHIERNIEETLKEFLNETT